MNDRSQLCNLGPFRKLVSRCASGRRPEVPCAAMRRNRSDLREERYQPAS